MNLANKHANSFPVNIFIAGDYDKAVISVREYCEAIGYCVTVTKTIYVYTGGEEEGVIIGLINYPRFPTGPNEILDHALALGQKLLVDLDQETFSIQNHRNTAWYSRRPLDLAPPVVVPPVVEPVPESVVEPIAEVVVEPVPDVEAPVAVSTGRKKKKTKGNKNNTSVVEVVEPIVEVVEASLEVVEPVAEVVEEPTEVVEEPTEVVEPIVEVVEAPVEVKSFDKRQLKKTKGNKTSVIETVEPIVEVVEPIMELAVEPIVEVVAIQAEVVSHKDRWTKKSKGNKNGTKSSKRR
jgi:hypothetical protein